MSLSIEIFPSKKLPIEWQNQLVHFISNVPESKGLSILIQEHSEKHYRIYNGTSPVFSIWLHNKDITTFKDEECFETVKNKETFDFNHFLHQFSSVDFTVLIDSKAGSNQNEFRLAIKAACYMGKITDGMITFDQTVSGFTPDYLYNDVKLLSILDQKPN